MKDDSRQVSDDLDKKRKRKEEKRAAKEQRREEKKAAKKVRIFGLLHSRIFLAPQTQLWNVVAVA